MEGQYRIVNVTSLCTTIIDVAAEPLSSVFLRSDDPEALKLGVQCIRISCFSLIFHSIVYNFNSYLMPIKRIRFCCLYSFLIECGCLVPITYIMIELTGYQGAWYAKIISMAVVSLLAVVYICCVLRSKYYNRQNIVRP